MLLLLQAGFAVLSLLEAAAIGVTVSGLPLLLPTLVLTGGVAVGTLVLVSRLSRRSARARRLAVAGEVLIVLGALIDLTLALGMAGRTLELMPALTRLGLPIAVVVLLRKGRRPPEPIQLTKADA